MKLLAEEEETEVSTEMPDEPKTRKRRTQRSKLEAPVNVSTLNNSLSGAFNAAAFLTKSNTRFTADDFDESSKKILNFINLFPPARIIIHLIGPITTVVDFVAKIQAINAGKRQKQEEKARATNGQVTIDYSAVTPAKKGPFG